MSLKLKLKIAKLEDRIKEANTVKEYIKLDKLLKIYRKELVKLRIVYSGLSIIVLALTIGASVELLIKTLGG